MNDKVEVLTNTSNSPVVRMPDRVYPGIVLQGDTLFSFYSRANKALAAIDQTRNESEYNALELLRDSLQGLVETYEAVLGENNIPLPY